MAFIRGQVVQLKSGGPKMTVQRIIGEKGEYALLSSNDEYLKIQGYKDGDLVCQWFEKNKLESGTFSQESVSAS